MVKKIFLFLLILVAAISFGAGVPAQAKTIAFEDKNLQFEVPDKYKIIEKDANSVNISSDDGQAKITLNFIPGSSPVAALSNIGKTLSKIIENPEPHGEASPKKINNISMILFEGKGNYQKKPVEFKASLIKATDEHIGFLLILADKKSTEKHLKEFLKILNSIKNIK